MSSLTDYAENKIIEHLFRNVAFTSPAAVYCALFTVSPSDSSGATEVAGAGYARVAMTFGAPSPAGVTENTNAASFTAVGGNFGTIVAVALMDALTGGNMLVWDGVASAIINDGDTFQVPVGQFDITLD